jgi:hypothetical protein
VLTKKDKVGGTATSNAELVQLQTRVIAIENLMIALMADGSSRQLELAREMSACIRPKPGYTALR